MHRLTFFPLGNADCFRVDLENGRQLLFDYAAMRDPKSETDLRIDLASTLRADLAKSGKDGYDVVAFTHLDSDHTKGASEFFWLDHAMKYQGEGRVRIRELWVPAAAIIEDGAEDEAHIIRAEARHRFRQGYGIRVFSRPARLKEWLASEGLSLESRRRLITDAGQIAPGFGLGADQVEFFVHSPFAIRQDANTVVDRNADSLVLHATFLASGRETKVLLTADITHEVISDIVRVTKRMGNEARLVWDVVDLPHHSSYLALGPEKGKEMTEPVLEVAWLYEQGQVGGIIVSPSWRIPSEDTDQPPHHQAARYYEARARAIGGEFKVTMEYPKPSAPAPLVIKIDGMGSAVEKVIEGAAAVIVTRPAPRAG